MNSLPLERRIWRAVGCSATERPPKRHGKVLRLGCRPLPNGRRAVNKAIGGALWLGVLAGLWAAAPVVSIGLNALFRPGYVVRDFGTEYYARLGPNRVYWHDF